MKKIVFPFLFVYCVLSTVYCHSQVKLTKSTCQKSHAGMGGVFMNYVIEFKNKSSDTIIIDSVKTIADTSEIRFASMKMQSGVYQISFGCTLSASAKCKTCVETTPPQPYMTKGVIIYYKRADKKSTCKVKKFKQLEDKTLP